MRIFSGIQPTGTLHIGNYFGAIQRWVKLQQGNDCIYCIVDYHALTNEDTVPPELRTARRELALDLVACGIDPARSILYVQSAVPEHTELCWILGCVASYGDLTRMTQFKEKAAKQEFVNGGLFYYPVLQAADILLYRADHVPVGEDQVQHLEQARRIARRFNFRFGETFPEPEPILGEGARIMSLADPERKMSKSAGPEHYIGLMEPEGSIRKKVRSAVTDVGLTPGQEMSPGVANLFALLELVAPQEVAEAFRRDHKAGKLLYRDLKEALFIHLMDALRPVRERRRELAARGDVDEILAQGAQRARAIAQKTMREVRARVGLD
ncbi:MAG TPA: tryptophan--tRNA ligase [Candidatus Bipolaricaulis sp.]|nr:tryptophan--tRNA ligase [Candidatus Bipolaricaulis sp.]MDY0392493.1 tryptophan--tRNA ligase [Candidatus Bipolaricaulis sp.]HPD06411.1 tryptophan--tRNA ligase [Candidatus Bipolaricaulis sp.]HRS14119.1 tryptophan--tRNA ligase [Candidatus Bipolaricaulis sp.]HRU21808.1 tryptophan--tRNA ligase [Candidatus Bipolaricaulis sp.]